MRIMIINVTQENPIIEPMQINHNERIPDIFNTYKGMNNDALRKFKFIEGLTTARSRESPQVTNSLRLKSPLKTYMKAKQNKKGKVKLKLSPMEVLAAKNLIPRELNF